MIAKRGKICDNVYKQMGESGDIMEKRGILERYFGYEQFRPRQEELGYLLTEL